MSITDTAGRLPVIDAQGDTAGFTLVITVVVNVFQNKAVGAKAIFAFGLCFGTGGDDAANEGGGAAVVELVALIVAINAALTA